MLDGLDSIFDITHTLPAITHSVALASRTPTAGFVQNPKYTPDYGGILETPTSNIKSHSLETEPPFRHKPKSFKIECKRTTEPISKGESLQEDCLVVATYLESYGHECFSSIRAVGKDLFLDFVHEEASEQFDNLSYTSSNYAHIPYSEVISSIKYSTRLDDLLLVKSNRCVKTIRLNKEYQGRDFRGSRINLSADHTALDFVSSVFEDSEATIKDACMNPFNKCILGVASDSSTHHTVKLYNVSDEPRQSFHIIKWDLHQDGLFAENIPQVALRSRVRTFTPTRKYTFGTRQLDNIPSHIANMVVTTGQQTILVDPRQTQVGQIFVDRSIPSFYPVELITKTEFSKKNDYQFYSLTNIHLRVFDFRYPNMPLNQVNHMMDSAKFNRLNIKLVNYLDNDLETLCLSSPEGIAFITFDQSQRGGLVNPKSIHPPYHDQYNSEYSGINSPELSGLAIRAPDPRHGNNQSFAVIQLLYNDIYLRRFAIPSDEQIEFQESDSTEITFGETEELAYRRSRNIHLTREISERDIYESGREEDEEIGFIDILQEPVIDLQTDSVRAKAKFEEAKALITKS